MQKSLVKQCRKPKGNGQMYRFFAVKRCNRIVKVYFLT